MEGKQFLKFLNFFYLLPPLLLIFSTLNRSIPLFELVCISQNQKTNKNQKERKNKNEKTKNSSKKI